MANYNNPAAFIPGTTIRVPNVYPGLPNGPRFVRPPQLTNFTMTNGMHRNINGNSYVPNMNMVAMNNMVNNPRIVNQMNQLQMRIPPIYNKPNTGIGKLLTFVECLGCDVMMGNLQDIQYWRNLTSSFFSEDTIMKYSLCDGVNRVLRRFEITYQVIPRFYQTFIESGVVKIQLVLGMPTERHINTPNGVQFRVDCPSCSIEYHFANGIQVTAPGQLTVMFNIFNNTLKMTSFDFVTSKFTEYVPRNLIQTVTPNMVVVNEFGIPFKTMRCLEVAEGVDYMQDVIDLTIKDSQTGPLQALRTINHNPQNLNSTPTISNNQNQRMLNLQAQLNGQNDIKNEPNYNGAPPTPNANDLQASAPTPTATPTPALTPTPTPSPLASNVNGIGSHQKNFSPALNEKRSKKKSMSTNNNKASPKKNA